MKRTSLKHLSLLTISLACVLLAGCTQQARKTRHLAKADKYFAVGAYPDAEVEYLNVLKEDQLDAHAFSRLGLIYSENGRITRAYPFLKRAQELDAGNLQVRLKLGQLNLLLGNLKAAQTEALDILEKDPKYPEAAALLAQTGKTPKDITPIRQRLDKLVEQTGVSAGTEIAFGLLALQAGQLNEAQTRFTHAQALNPKSYQAQYALGTLRWSLGDFTNAAVYLKQAAELSPPRALERVTYANFKLKTGAVDEGRQLLTAITKDTPDYLPAWGALAELALTQKPLTQKQFDECSACINQIQARDPENYQSQMLGARMKLLQGESAAAVAEYEKLAGRFHGSPQIHFQLALAYLFTGDSAKALKNFNETVSLDPNYDEAVLWQAQLNTQKDNPDAAIKSLVPLLERRPQLDMGYLYLAGAYAAKGDFANAVATCRRLEKLHPETPQVPFVIGGLLLKQNKTPEARREFAKARALAPDFLPALQQLVALDIFEKNFSAVLKTVETEIEKHPALPELRAIRARVLIAQTNLDLAERDLKKAIELDAGYRPAYMMLADLYVSSKKNEKALEELNQFVAQKPRDVPALMLIGMIQNERGNFAESRATYERLLAVDPNFGIALNNLAYLYSEKFGQLDKAYEMARKARDLAPYDPSSSDTLGWILFKRGDYSWALSLLQASAEKLPDEPEIFHHLGMTYYMMNDEVRAGNALKRAVASTRDFPGKEEARKRLALLALDYTQPGTEVSSQLEKRLVEQPDDPIALTHLAAIYEKQGATEKAAQVYEQVIKQNSGNPRLLINLARLYSEHLNNAPKALELAKAAYKLAPEDMDVAHMLGRLVFAGGQHKWALTLLQQGGARQSADAGLLYDLAWALYSTGQDAEAESTMHDALLSNPAFAHAPETRQFLDLLSLASDPAKAAEAAGKIQQLLKADPNNIPALMASAAAAEQRAEISAANDTLEQVLQRYPDFTPAIKKLAGHYSETPGKEQRAYELAVKAREALPKDAEVAKTLGIISYRRGDFQGAARLLNQSAQNETTDGKTFYYLGMAQHQLKQAKASKSALQKALNLNLPSQLAEEAKRVLAQTK